MIAYVEDATAVFGGKAASVVPLAYPLGIDRMPLDSRPGRRVMDHDPAGAAEEQSSRPAWAEAHRQAADGHDGDRDCQQDDGDSPRPPCANSVRPR